jgi:hypothetical protein
LKQTKRFREAEFSSARQIAVESISYEIDSLNTPEFPGNFARSSINMELEIVLR